MKFNVCLMQPMGYIHSLALLEAAEYCVNKLRTNGHEVILTKNRLIYDGVNVIFGAHINPEAHQNLPSKTVIFNTEQLTAESNWLVDGYRKLLSNNYVWDYSVINYEQIPHSNKALIYFSYDAGLKRIPKSINKTWDLVFYGSMSDRRNKILEALSSKGLKVKTIFGLYGRERDEVIGQAKAVLNLHFYESQVLQQIRIFYPLINHIPVISENYSLHSAPAEYGECIFTPGDQPFVDFVVNLMKDRAALDMESEIKSARFEAIERAHDFKVALKNTIEYFQGPKFQEGNLLEFTRINLGSGKDYRQGYLNIDVRDGVVPDVLIDLSAPLNFPIECKSTLYGTVLLEEGHFEEIIANDVLEHVSNLEGLMGACLKLLKVGGQFVINVPYDLSIGAWQDPTHIRAFNQNSWLYYTDWFWYLGWFKHRFELVELSFNPSQSGFDLINKHTAQEVVLSTPRAIDSMKVILIKSETTAEERTLARSYNNDLLF